MTMPIPHPQYVRARPYSTPYRSAGVCSQLDQALRPAGLDATVRLHSSICAGRRSQNYPIFGGAEHSTLLVLPSSSHKIENARARSMDLDVWPLESPEDVANASPGKSNTKCPQSRRNH